MLRICTTRSISSVRSSGWRTLRANVSPKHTMWACRNFAAVRDTHSLYTYTHARVMRPVFETGTYLLPTKIYAKYGGGSGGDSGGGSSFGSSPAMYTPTNAYVGPEEQNQKASTSKSGLAWFIGVVMLMFYMTLMADPSEEQSFRAAQRYFHALHSEDSSAMPTQIIGKKEWQAPTGSRVRIEEDGSRLLFTRRTFTDRLRLKKEYVDVVAQLDHPIDAEHGLQYFEVVIEKMPSKGTVAVGLAPRPWPYWRLPGWHAGSIGFHGDDGHLFVEDPNFGIPYGQKFQQGDTIGCGRSRDGKYIFTLNGKPLAKVQFIPTKPVYPTIGTDCEATLRTTVLAQAPL